MSHISQWVMEYWELFFRIRCRDCGRVRYAWVRCPCRQ